MEWLLKLVEGGGGVLPQNVSFIGERLKNILLENKNKKKSAFLRSLDTRGYVHPTITR